MFLGSSIVLVVQFFFCLIPYYGHSNSAGPAVFHSMFLDQPAIMIVSFAILTLAIVALYKEKMIPFVNGSAILYATYFIAAPISVMVKMGSANFTSIICIILSLVSFGLSLADIIRNKY